MTETGGRALEVRFGMRTETGARPRNEDYCGVYREPTADRRRIGLIAAVADGVGGHRGGREAAELTLRMFIDGCLGGDSRAPPLATAARSLDAANAWIHSLGRRDPELARMACAFSALILRGRFAYLAHVGDTRAYRFRDGASTQLTVDHVAGEGELRHALTRAVGLAETVRIDGVVEELRAHDRYLVCSDGLHGSLSQAAIDEALSLRAAPDETADRLVEAALARGSSDNVTALVVDIVVAPASEMADLEFAAASLAIIDPPKPGARIDQYRVESVLSDGRYSRVLRATSVADGRAVVLKLPKPIVGADAGMRAAFVREGWVASRVSSPFVGEAAALDADRMSCLYTVMPFYEGETLEKRIASGRTLSIGAGLSIAVKLARAVIALHRSGVIHRDVKPDNVILQGDGGLKLVDLGVARVLDEDVDDLPGNPGTPSYTAPELFQRVEANERTDQFALGVTVYRMFSGAYPYGEIEPFSRPRFGAPTPLARLRPDLPAWLAYAIERAVAARPEDRFADVIAFLFELEHGAERARPVAATRRPLYQRNPVAVWKAVSALLALALLLALTHPWSVRRSPIGPGPRPRSHVMHDGMDAKSLGTSPS